MSDSDPRRIANTSKGEPRRAYLRAKRLLDVVLASAGLLFLLPAACLVALLLLLADGRPLLFRQRRIGRNGKEFHCLKFRTMRRDADKILHELLQTCPKSQAEWAQQQKLSNDPRIHFIGRFLRFTSLDELPQLINILRGEMSLVGPRPIVADEISRYGESLYVYLAMTPGLTGMWQVCRTPNTTYAERIGFDVEYFRTRSLGLDLKLIVETVRIVLLARNVG